MRVDGEKVFLSHDEVIEAVKWSNDHIHSIRGGGMIMIGCDWSKKTFEEYLITHELQICGPTAKGLGHAIGCIDEHGMIAFETNMNKIQEFEEKAVKNAEAKK